MDVLKTGGSERPNVLFISFDDLNHYAGFLGRHPDAVTPHFDRLAGQSMVFERAYCQAPICNPSRASLMTGLLPSTTGVYGNRHPFRLSDAAQDAVTLPQHFRRSGYRASGSGKVYHGIFPDPMSWDAYAPSPWQQAHRAPRPRRQPLHGIEGLDNLDWGPLDVADAEMADHQAVTHCIAHLKQAQDQPFFLTCGLTVTHLPWYTPRGHYEKFDPAQVSLPDVVEDDLADVPEIARKWTNRHLMARIRETGRWNEVVAAYLACIHFADVQIGRLLDALDRSAYAHHTIVVLWGDHGWHLGEKAHWKKSTLWEEATRVPLLIRAPGFAGGRCKKPVGLIDVYPTLIDLCGLPARSGLAGQSLMGLMENPDRTWERPALTTHGRGNHAVRSERWRYICYRDGTEELYDHSRDEMEWTNLAGDPGYAAVKRDLARWLPEVNAPDAETVADGAMYRARLEQMMVAL